MNFIKAHLIKILTSLFCIVLIFFALRIVFDSHTANSGRKLGQEAAEIYEGAKTENNQKAEESTVPGQPTSAQPNEASPEPSQDPQPREAVVRPEFSALQKEYDNEDIVGFLTIEGTSIKYPVVQAEDNDFYLLRDINKKSNQAGSIFLDYENDIETGDMNTIIYGHNMKDNIMFHDLRKYSDFSFWQEHKYIQFNTLYDDMIFEIFSYYTPDVSFPYIYANYEEKVFGNLLAKIDEMAHYDTGVNIKSTDRIIQLSTCTNTNDNTRMVIAGKLIELNGEKFQDLKQ